MEKSYKQFVDKLNAYIRKFYLYQLIRGFILFLVLLLIYFSCISSLEYFNYFDPKIKSVILILTICLTLIILVYFILIPLSKLSGIGKRINYYDVSAQLQNTYPEIRDRLINIVELANNSDLYYSSQLQQASINQKIDELKIFRFSDAISFKNLKLLFLIFTGIVLLLIGVFIVSPSFFTESSARLIHFQQKFEKPAPFTFELLNSELEIVTGESIELKLKCSGKEIPEMMFIDISGNRFLMENQADLFSYKIENVNSSVSILFTDKKYISEIYRITVLNKPFINSFIVEINPPAYTNGEKEILTNIGDLNVIEGSTVKWIFNTVDTDSLELFFTDSSHVSAKQNGNSFEVIRSIARNVDYSVRIKNSKLNNDSQLVYKIQTISDLFPEIKVVQVRDSSDFRIFHFKGNIIDDYGFSQLDFNLSVEGNDSILRIPFTPSMLNQDFYYSFNFEAVKNLGKSFKYYFSVSDNDVINRFKRSISDTYTFNFPDYQEILAKENSDLNSLDKLFEKSTKLTEEIQNEFENFKMKQINSELSEWEKYQTVKDIVAKKNELENVLQQINQQNKDANNFMNSFTEEKQDILKKQKEIEELLNEVFSDELKKLFEEFNELSKKFDLQKFNQLSNQMDSKMEDLSKQLDKNMQLLKKMKVEQKIERILQELQKLSETENTVLESLSKNPDLKSINEIEKNNASVVEKLEKEYNETLEINKTLQKPLNLFNFEQEFSQVKSNYTKVLNEAGKGNKRKTAAGIENTISSLNQLTFAINQMLQNNKKKQNQENIDDLKQLLDNLILVSFDQEKIMNSFSNIDYNNPLIRELKVKQKNIGGMVSFIKDSLYALSKRTPEISSVINKEMQALEANTNSSYDQLENGNLGGSRMHQQFSITSSNNLALFLSEALENIKEQQDKEGGSEGDCEKPGGKGSKPGMKQLKDGQESIKEQLQQMIDQMKKGELGRMGKNIGQTIAQQEVMQQMIREMLNGSSLGTKAQEQLKAVDQLLEQSRKELINRSISNELINRQNLILSKLLDAEKSEIERDFEDKRESKTAMDIKKGNPEGYFEYKNALKNENEKIKRNTYRLRSFYDQKYNQYLNKLKN